jgi:hypothetical protein
MNYTLDNRELDISNKIYRFKFTDDFIKELAIFSKVHQYDERADFKEAWLEWITNFTDLVETETRRLLDMGYDGDILDKMYKSGRYYFRKKSMEKKDHKKRREYIGVSTNLLNAMDMDIKVHVLDENYQPKTAFIRFCKENTDILKESIKEIYSEGCRDCELIEDKIKKTYKNRYFIFKNNNSIK